ncbi:MAG TPA: alpha/beta hydrolase [Actinophytocola sp.]|uniref:alpha/beta hydrolase family protein n=1 Tax=Actinophytocola sp. TaxID=1872138 RepID=UPI002DDCCA2C|nr:alpha/beta hydrolase [Actinophytocola sp.]HEV2781300.1 alpha/beta hydrolase [Actinophytocola sp.]
MRIGLTALSTVMIATCSFAMATPAAGQVACAAPVPSPTQPGYTIADPHCDFGTTVAFTPLTDDRGREISRVYAGIANGSAYRIEVPKRWNRELVLFAHGFRGTGTTVWVDDPALRRFHVEQGFAWAASSYQTNGYDVGHGVTDTHALIDLFGTVTGARSRNVYLTGVSMGGHITAAAIEHHRGDFVGAMPYCGVLGDKELFDFFLDANVTAAALTGAAIRFPATLAEGQAYAPEFRQQVLGLLPRLGTGFNTPDVRLSELGMAWQASVEQRSGGTRPGMDSAMAYWSSFGRAPLTDIPFLFGLYPGLSAGTAGIAPGNVTDNRRTVYQLDGNPALSGAERALNAAVLRVAPTASASPDLTGIPAVTGDPRIPVLSLHTIGDLFVPLSMEQIYAREVAAHHQSRLFVARAVRGNAHCGFTQAELRRGFTDLVRWVRTGHRPPGDDILSRHTVSRPTFGCRFTDGAHPEFVGVPCPPRSVQPR